MSVASGTPGQVTHASDTPKPKEAPLTAIQVIEREIFGLTKQHDQAVGQVHAIEGAIQGHQHLIAVLKAEAAKAEALAKEALGSSIGQTIEAQIKSDAPVIAAAAEKEIEEHGPQIVAAAASKI